jgi:membrane protein
VVQCFDARKEVLPSALATAIFWLGMEVVFSIIFSGMVISNEQKYGPIGVVFSLMSWLIAIGVVIILGAIIGVVWRERGLSFAAAFRRLSRRHGRGTAEPGPTPPDSVPL